ncbi:TraR/DksA family transcriptional regulator [Vibrio cholerae]|uniref:TraR/DksA family transcriptional regulator n=2 Tax=Vibrio cholerae TaxID=666 RepID=UPI000E0C4DF3|nr:MULTISPECIES: TraR/DksA family transcriptional regulator [Vibrio]EGQ8324836.1 TraR/DksA family transcriptional regulator [Vibrio cholerae]EGR0364809.1 TraR/DksA family transcriptional regulator [Vibrio cholerae]EGR0413041.1 TraR/DksA family transcriptional regulator [Vibrio cholerae]EGR0612188.1 TraR/DksA family transcriptional regulator [Vibrio cholerae]EGR1017923.1 TraR/DksA family transcriptional regulator [Vibrio cholerae]
MDVIDDAAKTEAKFQQMALANHRARAMQTAHLPSRTHCLECDDPIPKARQESIKGCKYCTQCQAEKEGK